MSDFRIARVPFLKALKLVTTVAGKESEQPILTAVLLTTSDNRLQLTGTNLAVSITTALTPEKVAVGGRVLLDAKKLCEIVGLITEPEIRLKAAPNHAVEIVAGKSKFKIAGYDPQDFPSVDSAFRAPQFYKVSASVLAQMLTATAFAASRDDNARYQMCGVNIRSVVGPDGKTRVVMAATDSHRLSRIEKVFDNDLQVPAGGLTVPSKGLAVVHKLAESAGDGELEVGFPDTAIAVRSGDTTVSVRVIEAEFVKYDAVIPASIPNAVSVDNSALSAALRRVSVITSEGKAGCVKLDLSKDSLVVSAVSPEFGEARDEVACLYSGDPVTVGFNCKYLLDGLAAAEQAEVALSIPGESSPGVIKGKDDSGYLYVIMPMRL